MHLTFWYTAWITEPLLFSVNLSTWHSVTCIRLSSAISIGYSIHGLTHQSFYSNNSTKSILSSLVKTSKVCQFHDIKTGKLQWKITWQQAGSTHLTLFSRQLSAILHFNIPISHPTWIKLLWNLTVCLLILSTPRTVCFIDVKVRILLPVPSYL